MVLETEEYLILSQLNHAEMSAHMEQVLGGTLHLKLDCTCKFLPSHCSH